MLAGIQGMRQTPCVDDNWNLEKLTAKLSLVEKHIKLDKREE